MELSLPQEHAAVLATLTNINDYRAYTLEHGIDRDGRQYSLGSGSMRSTLSCFPPLWRLEARNEDDSDQRLIPHHDKQTYTLPDATQPLNWLLTAKEFEIVRMLHLGTDRCIANILQISEGVVGNVLKSVAEKTDLHDRCLIFQRYVREWKAGLHPDYACPIDSAYIFVELDHTDLVMLKYAMLEGNQIAQKTRRKLRTVKRRIAVLKHKLGLNCRAALVACAELKGMLNEEA
jgi:DNA-binding CsgD family transcriptional regulator